LQFYCKHWSARKEGSLLLGRRAGAGYEKIAVTDEMLSCYFIQLGLISSLWHCQYFADRNNSKEENMEKRRLLRMLRAVFFLTQVVTYSIAFWIL
jgi:hypothetical protein